MLINCFHGGLFVVISGAMEQKWHLSLRMLLPKKNAMNWLRLYSLGPTIAGTVTEQEILISVSNSFTTPMITLIK